MAIAIAIRAMAGH